MKSISRMTDANSGRGLLLPDGLDGDARSVFHGQSIDPQETRTVNEETRGAQRAINKKLKADS